MPALILLGAEHGTSRQEALSLDWDDIEEQKDVITDFQKISKIRKDHQDIFHNNWYETHLINVSYTSEPFIEAKPYVRFLPGKKAVVVIGNYNMTEDVTFNLHIPIEEIGFNDKTELTITDLWTGDIQSINTH